MPQLTEFFKETANKGIFFNYPRNMCRSTHFSGLFKGVFKGAPVRTFCSARALPLPYQY